jgi:ribosomal protein L20
MIEAGVELNRKILSDLAISDVPAFDAIVEIVKPFIKAPAKKAA